MKLFCKKCSQIFKAEKPESGNTVNCPACKAEIPYPETPTSPGVVIGDFLIEKPLSKGGMGEVFLARQISLDRPVALKVLQQKFVHDREYVESLFREARAAAKINHPNIVQAYAVGEEDGVFYFAMEFIRGETFKQILKREGKLDFQQAAKVICEIARALNVAWQEQKLVHQDIKPDNIMLDSHGIAKLADLGLARNANVEEEIGDEVLGTPQYISPEQLTGVPTDVRSDIYSLGATFYQFVTGRFPYVADSAEDIAKMHVAGNLEPPKQVNPELPDELNAIIMKMMARDINERYQTPEPLIKALEIYMHNAESATGGIAPVPQLRIGGSTSKSMPKLKIGAGKGGLTVPGGKAAGQKVVSVPGRPSAPKVAVPVKPVFTGAAKPVVPSVPGTGAKPVVPQLTPPNVPKSPVPQLTPPSGVTPPVPQLTPPNVPKSPVPQLTPPSGATPPVPQLTPPGGAKPPVPQLTPTGGAPTSPPGAAAGEKAEPEKDERRKLSPKAKKIIRLAVIGVAAFLIIMFGAATTIYILHGKERLPEFLKPAGAWIASIVQSSADAGTGEAASGNDVPAGKPVPSGPVSRPEYLAGVEEAISLWTSEPDAVDKQLAAAEKFLATAPAPRTDEERAALNRLLAVYARPDENRNFAPAREVAREAHLKAIAALRARDEAAQQAEEARREQAERRRQESAALAEQIREQQQEIEREAQERSRRFNEAVDHACEALAASFYSAALDGDSKALEAALAASAELQAPPDSNKASDKANLARLELWRRELPREAEKLSGLVAELKKVTTGNTFSLQIGRQVGEVTEIAPGNRLRFRTARGQEGTFTLKDQRLEKAFFSALSSRIKFDNLRFYYALMNKNFDDPALKSDVPSGFWRSNLEFFVQAVRRGESGNDNTGK